MMTEQASAPASMKTPATRARRMARPRTTMPPAPTKAAPPAPAKAVPPASASTAPPVPTKPSTKSATLIALLSRPKGATLDDMMMATGWQAHSVRGFLAGTLKKKLGHPLTSHSTDKGRVYRIEVQGQ